MKNIKQISIIGAGPTGNYLAYLLAKKGWTVNVFEEHKNSGEPVQCTGIVTKSLFDIVDYDKSYIVNKLSKCKVVAPNGNKIIIPLEEYVICRVKFDRFLMNQAKKAGANYYFKHKFIGREGHIIKLKNKGQIKKIHGGLLIGADGPHSLVAKTSGILNCKKFYYGVQATVSGKFDSSMFEVYLGEQIPKFFAWIVPENEKIARVGLATLKNPKKYFDEFIKKFDYKIIEMQGGTIPIYNHKEILHNTNKDTFLIGDSANFVKATTGGGLVQGLSGVKILANYLLSEKSKKDNVKKMKKLRLELWTHKKIRDMLNTFTDKDYNYLIKLMNGKYVKQTLSSTSRDKAVKLMPKLLLFEPRFLYFIKNLIKSI